MEVGLDHESDSLSSLLMDTPPPNYDEVVSNHATGSGENREFLPGPEPKVPQRGLPFLQYDNRWSNFLGNHRSYNSTQENIAGNYEERRLETTLDSSNDSMPPAADGGYGWVICISSFLIMIILDGMLFSFGVFFLDLLDYFQESRGKTALVGSTLMGTHLIVGPFTSALVNLFGCRVVAMVGAVFATVAFTCSAFVPSVEVLIFTYGILGGIGVSMIYIPSILIVGFYFERRRALANGIAASGSGVGAFVYAPLCRMLQDYYGWRGALLILAGLVLNCLVLAALFRPVRKNIHSASINSDDSQPFPANSKKTKYPGEILKQKLQASLPAIPVHTSNLSLNAMHTSGNTSHCNISYGNISIDHVTGSCNMIDKQVPSSINTVACFRSMVTIPATKSNIHIPMVLRHGQKTHQSLLRHKHLVDRPLYRNDLFYSGSVYELNSDHDVKYTKPENFKSKSTELVDDALNEDGSQCFHVEELTEGLKIVLGLSLLQNPILLLCILMGVLWTTHASVLTILPNYATLCGISKFHGGFLLSIVGITNIIGRLIAGMLADRFDCVKINMAALLTGGLVNLVIPFFTSYSVLAGCAAVFGLCMGTWTSLRPIVLVNLLGLNNLTNAFGLMAMFQGGAFCIGSPIAGMLYDYNKSYKLPFIIAGVAFLISGLLCIPLRIMGNKRGHLRSPDFDVIVSCKCHVIHDIN